MRNYNIAQRRNVWTCYVAVLVEVAMPLYGSNHGLLCQSDANLSNWGTTPHHHHHKQYKQQLQFWEHKRTAYLWR